MDIKVKLMDETKKIIGVTFFSVLQGLSNKYVIHKKDYNDYMADLFSKSRLDLKSEIFFELSLPSLQQMDKKGCSYKHYILYSEQLPEYFKLKIQKALSEYSFLKGVQIDDYNSFDIKSILSEDVDKEEVFAYFGLDDDDLISIDYLQKIKRYINEEFIGFNISLSKGFSGYYDGKISNIREFRFPFINIGQARVCNRTEYGDIYIPKKGSHMRTDEYCPTIVDSTSPTFFWLRHHMQDTFSTSNLSDIKAKINRDLDEHGYPKSSFLKKFPALKDFIVPKKEVLKLSSDNILLSERKLVNKPFLNELSKQSLGGHLVVKYQIRNLDGISRRQAIAVFELSKNLEKNDVELAGLAESKVGYYRYFNTASSELSGTFSLYLPDGIELVGINLMKWGEENILVNNIEVFVTSNYEKTI